MTDLERFLALYKDFGINLDVKENNDPEGFYVTLHPYDSEKIDDYYGFYSHINFDKEGKFINQGFYE